SSGAGTWITDGEKPAETLFALPRRTPVRTAISSYYHWSDADTLVVTAKYVENAHHDVFTFVFSDDGLEVHLANSVSLFREEPDPRPTLTAHVDLAEPPASASASASAPAPASTHAPVSTVSRLATPCGTRLKATAMEPTYG